MLVFQAKHVLSVTPVVENPYDFKDEKTGKDVKGVSIKGTITAVGVDDRVAVITVKGKKEDTLQQVQAKMDALKIRVGQSAEILIEPTLVGGVAQLRAATVKNAS